MALGWAKLVNLKVAYFRQKLELVTLLQTVFISYAYLQADATEKWTSGIGKKDFLPDPKHTVSKEGREHFLKPNTTGKIIIMPKLYSLSSLSTKSRRP